MEKPDYRLTLEQLNNKFDHDFLTISEVAEFTGVNRHRISETYAQYFKVVGKSKVINKCTLARLMS